MRASGHPGYHHRQTTIITWQWTWIAPHPITCLPNLYMLTGAKYYYNYRGSLTYLHAQKMFIGASCYNCWRCFPVSINGLKHLSINTLIASVNWPPYSILHGCNQIMVHKIIDKQHNVSIRSSSAVHTAYMYFVLKKSTLPLYVSPYGLCIWAMGVAQSIGNFEQTQCSWLN